MEAKTLQILSTLQFSALNFFWLSLQFSFDVIEQFWITMNTNAINKVPPMGEQYDKIIFIL